MQQRRHRAKAERCHQAKRGTEDHGQCDSQASMHQQKTQVKKANAEVLAALLAFAAELEAAPEDPLADDAVFAFFAADSPAFDPFESLLITSARVSAMSAGAKYA